MNRAYDPQIKMAIALSKNPYLFPEEKIPRSTARYWIKSYDRSARADYQKEEVARLKAKNQKLKTALKMEKVKLKVLMVTIDAFQISFDQLKVPKAEDKIKILDAIEEARKLFQLKTCLELIGFSKSRYQKWKARKKKCCLDDRSHCPKSRPQQITFEEKRTMRDLSLAKSSPICLCPLFVFLHRETNFFIVRSKRGEMK